MNFLRRWFAAPAVQPRPPVTRSFVLYFSFRVDENWRWRASIVNGGVDDLDPNGWATVEEAEADLPSAVGIFYESVRGELVCMTHYHPRSRTMLVVSRPCPSPWQDWDKKYTETVRDMVNDATQGKMID